jgi:Fic family protein
VRSFSDINRILANQPPRLGGALSRIDVGSGREQLFAEQLPQVLQGLAEATRVASIQASTAIEGYDVPGDRAEQIARRPDARFRNRNEKEFAGYRDAADEMVRAAKLEPITPAFPFYLATRLHRYTTGEPGRPKQDQNSIASYENGVRRIVFTPVAPELTESSLRSLITGYNDALDDRAAHPVLLLGLFVLDFLAIHPVADGNGRIARLLTVHEFLRLGYGVARYVSIEQLIFESKNSYYDALEASQRDWHDGQHDPWPWLTYFVTILADAYEQFEAKLSAARNATGTKAEQARRYILHEAPDTFRFAEAAAALPGISTATLRQVLNALRDEGELAADRGPKAQWRRVGAAQAADGRTVVAADAD